jgi:hypothetical protein
VSPRRLVFSLLFLLGCGASSPPAPTDAGEACDWAGVSLVQPEGASCDPTEELACASGLSCERTGEGCATRCARAPK